MAKKPTKTAGKKPSTRVGDLSARKDPKGGAQKREGPAMDGSTRGPSSTRASKPRLS